jgi:hypothetical protein
MRRALVMFAAAVAGCASQSFFDNSAPFAYFSTTDVQTTVACVMKQSAEIRGGYKVSEGGSAIEGAREITLASASETVAIVRVERGGEKSQVTGFARKADGDYFVVAMVRGCATPFR